MERAGRDTEEENGKEKEKGGLRRVYRSRVRGS